MPKALVDPLHAEIAAELGKVSRNPLAFCQKAFKDQPRAWQAQILRDIGAHLQGHQRFSPFQCAVASGHGIGKSALVGMLISWALFTCERAKVLITANTLDQLRTKTWPEANKWFKGCDLYKLGWFEVTATAIKCTLPDHAEAWRADLQSWSENNTEAFQGLHNERKRIVLIFDEASAISDKVWEVAEGALTDKNTEILWFAFGNPTRNSGRFRECFGKLAAYWKTYQIDSRTVEGTNLEKIAQWQEIYGEDSDWFRYRVRGEFPRSGSNQLIPSDAIAAARKYRAEGYEKLPKILAVDVARFGEDQTVIGWRQGRKAVILKKYRGLDTVQTAERTIEFIQQENPDAVVVDGDGLGAGTVDHIRHRGFGQKLFEFHGGASPDDPQMYFNKRAEVWGRMKDWLVAGAEIPDDPELADDLEKPTYDTAQGKRQYGSLVLESKDDMKARGLRSPDIGDMLAMTFAVKVAPKPKVLPRKPVSAWS